MRSTRVLITGVRGKTGVELAGLLRARPEVEVLGGSSRPGSVDLPGVVPTAFSWDDPTTFAAATDGAGAVFVVRPDRPDAPDLIGELVARTPSSARLVLLSEQDADFTGPDGWAPRAEAAVREAGHAWTILRPSWFMQVFTDPRFYGGRLAETGVLDFPSEGARVAWVDARDIAAVAERALLDDGHAGAVHVITGPEALTLPRTAELLSESLGAPVRHSDVTVEEAVAGMEGFERELTELTFARVRAGSFAPVSDTVERVTGRRARSLQEFLGSR
ncbi:NAD(P)H-binding protein [Alloalcanivorax gelatiniphagus]